jgi:hypothetical protein
MAQTIPASDFVDALFSIWEEIVGHPAKDGGSTFVLDDDAGWMHSLTDVSAEAASRPIAPGGTTIAAQTAHTAYYLERFEATIANRHERADWPGSFRPATVDEAEWTRQRERLFGVAERVGDLMRGNPTWPREHVAGALANLTHLAYHLGAVRQMLRVVRG